MILTSIVSKILQKSSNAIQHHPVIVIFLAVFGVLGGAASIYALFSKKEQKPVYHKSSVSVVTSTLTDKASGLKISYNDEPINNLTISKIGLINLGKEIIQRSDIPPKGKLAFEFPQGLKIYNKQILFATDTANDVCIYHVVDIEDDKLNTSQKEELLKELGNKVYIDFEFLAENEGTVIQIAHSLDSKSSNIKLIGNPKGTNIEFQNIGDQLGFYRTSIPPYFIITVLIILIVLLIYAGYRIPIVFNRISMLIKLLWKKRFKSAGIVFNSSIELFSRQIYGFLFLLLWIIFTVFTIQFFFRSEWIRKSPKLTFYLDQFISDWKLDDVKQNLEINSVELDKKKVKIEKTCQ